VRTPRTPPWHGLLVALVLLAVLPTRATVPAWWSALGVRDLGGAPLKPPGRWFVVVFIGQDCPVSNASIPVLNKLASDFGSRGFSFIGAYVDPTADITALRTHASDYALGFSVADDRSHALTRAAGATYTPEVAVFNAAGSKLYLGRIDDKVGDNGVSRPAAAHEDLHDVLSAVASGAKGPFEGKPGYGCAIPEAVHP